MRRLLPLLLLAACATEAPPAPTPTPEPTPDTRYVAASRLNLRAGPDAVADKLGQLAVNSPVAVLQQQTGFARVRAANGTEGWVASDYLAPSPMTVAEAVAKAEAEPGGPPAVLSWWQRAAAIDGSDRAVMRGLADAYRAAGEAELAARVERRLTFPASILPVAATGARFVGDGGLRILAPQLIEVERRLVDAWVNPKVLTAADYAEYGVAADESWWVLPSWGPAVRASLKEHRLAIVNECGGTLAVVTELTAELPGDAYPLAATAGEPPAAWAAGSLPGRPYAEAERLFSAALEQMPSAPGGVRTLAIAAAEGGWTAEASWTLPEDRWQDCGPAPCGEGVIGWSLPDGGELTESGRRESFDLFTSLQVATRDLDGDGVPERISSDNCAATVFAADGALIAQTAYRCCGC
jgi:hypothetical protein